MIIAYCPFNAQSNDILINFLSEWFYISFRHILFEAKVLYESFASNYITISFTPFTFYSFYLGFLFCLLKTWVYLLIISLLQGNCLWTVLDDMLSRRKLTEKVDLKQSLEDFIELQKKSANYLACWNPPNLSRKSSKYDCQMYKVHNLYSFLWHYFQCILLRTYYCSMMTLKNYERASAKYFDKEIFNNQTINLHQVLHQFNYLLEYFNINLPCYTNSVILSFDLTTLINNSVTKLI